MENNSLNVTFYHKHNNYVPRYEKYEDKLIVECQFTMDEDAYTLHITPSDFVKYKISSVNDMLDFIFMNGFNPKYIDKLHILTITSDDPMKEMAELFSVYDYWKVLSVIQKL